MRTILPITLFIAISFYSGCLTTQAPETGIARESQTRVVHPLIPNVAPARILADLDKAYADALEDASNPTPEEIVYTLNPISKENEDLLWKRFDGEDYVLVETWVSASNVGYYQNGPDGFYQSGSHLIWVSCPYLQELCSKHIRRSRFGAAPLPAHRPPT